MVPKVNEQSLPYGPHPVAGKFKDNMHLWFKGRELSGDVGRR